MWELLGGSYQPFRVVAARPNGVDGRLEVFGIAEDDSVWRNAENTPFADDWTGWSPFVTAPPPGRLPPPQHNPQLRTLSVDWVYPGLLRVFGSDRDGSAWINEQTSNLQWRGWRPFGFGSPTWRRPLWGWWRPQPQGLREVVGAISVAFGLGVDGTVWVTRHTGPTQWGGWRTLGDGSLALSTLAFTTGWYLRLEVYGTAPDNTIWTNSTADFGVGWSGWQSISTGNPQLHAVTAIGEPTYGPTAVGSDVFGLALDDTVWRRAPGSNTWVQFGGPADRLSTITSFASNYFPAYAEVAGTAPDHTIWHAVRGPSGQWGPLEPFGSSSDRLRQLTFVQGIVDTRMHTFGTDPDGVVWHKAQTTSGTWPPP